MHRTQRTQRRKKPASVVSHFFEAETEISTAQASLKGIGKSKSELSFIVDSTLQQRSWIESLSFDDQQEKWKSQENSRTVQAILNNWYPFFTPLRKSVVSTDENP